MKRQEREKPDGDNTGGGIGREKPDGDNTGVDIGQVKPDGDNTSAGIGRVKPDGDNTGGGIGREKPDGGGAGIGRDIAYIAEAVFILAACALPLFVTPGGYNTITQDKFQFLLVSTVCCVLAIAAVIVYSLLMRDGFRILPLPRGGESEGGSESESTGESAGESGKSAGGPLRSLKRSPRRSLPRAAGIAAMLAALLYLCSAIVSTILCEDKVIAVWGLNQRNDGLITQAVYVAIFLIISRFYVYRRRDMIIFGVCSSVVAVYAILQLCGVDLLKLFRYEDFPDPIVGLRYNSYSILYRSTIGNINILSTFACVTSVFFGILYLITEHKRRLFYLAVGCLCFYTLFTANSDSGLIGFAAAFVLMLPFCPGDRKQTLRLFTLLFAYSGLAALWRLHVSVYGLRTMSFSAWTHSIWVLAFLACGALLVACKLVLRLTSGWPSQKTVRRAGLAAALFIIVAGLAGIEILGARSSSGLIFELRQVLRGMPSDRFGSNRMFVWRRALTLVREHPLFGTGPDSFFTAFGRFQQESLAATDVYFDKAHNEYLQILICLGFTGLISYLALVGSSVTAALKRVTVNRRLLPFLGGAAAYLAQAFFNISVPITAPLLWVFLGVLASGVKNRRQPEELAVPDN